MSSFINVWETMKPLSNLDEVLDAAMDLPLEQQEMLIQILKNRIVENRRDEIASDAAVSIAEFQAGRLKVQTAAEAIQELREYLDNPSITDV
jgi:transcriptional regulator with AAA-type ATPase domain